MKEPKEVKKAIDEKGQKPDLIKSIKDKKKALENNKIIRK